ncbi:hypothetical protein GCM10009582_17930 [Arthrobacter flavus]|uniref:hypothetical protein n=1 Tax=Arthrobacter flavus TaxID=95172 RepID=UPI0031D9B0C4
MRPMSQYLIVIVSVLSTFAVNIALDVFTELSLLSRGLISILCGLLITHVIVRWSERRRKQKNAAALTES